MLDVINRLAHGYVAVPVMRALQARGVFAELAGGKTLPLPELANAFQVNLGHLSVAWRMLQGLGYAAPAPGEARLLESAAELSHLPAGVETLYGVWTPLAEATNLGPWIDRALRRWDGAPSQMADLLDGAVLLPPLVALADVWAANSILPPLATPLEEPLLALLAQRGWTEPDAPRNPTLAGRFLLDRIRSCGTVLSYRPMLHRADDLLFGDCAQVFVRQAGGQESHVDRTLNVEASGFQHETYFQAAVELVVEVFDQAPLESQPRAVLDTGCGDGSFLRAIYEAVRTRTRRGRHLEAFPLTLIGADFNAAARAASERTLAGLPHAILHGDIGDPHALVAALRDLQIEQPDNVLHVRSFLDHDRPFHPSLDGPAAVGESTALSVGLGGELIGADQSRASLEGFLRRWSEVIGRHGLIVLEVHCVPPATAHAFLEESESIHFDAYHGFSSQHLVEPEAFLAAAASVGLFPRSRGVAFPRVFEFTRITLNHFEKRRYRIRRARLDDLQALTELETRCWVPGLRTPVELLRRRLEAHPAWQFVLEIDARVAGVCFTQPILGPASLLSARWNELDDMRCESGRTLQLLNLCIDPADRAGGIGDELLEFVLQWATCNNRFDDIAGVSRCGDFTPTDAARPLDIQLGEHVARRDAGGHRTDRVLAFHEGHGAKIGGLVRDYRPEDTANGGFGVAISYVRKSPSRPGDSTDSGAARPAAGLGDEVADLVVKVLAESGKQVSGPPATTQPFMEMGLDSVELLKLRAALAARFQTKLESTFLFRHNTIDAAAVALGAKSRKPPSPDPIDPEASSAFSRRSVESELEPIAVVGLACRFPGGGPKGFLSLLNAGANAVVDAPPEPPRRALLTDIPPAFRKAGYLNGADLFDARLFRISPAEAELMDPQQRILLELTWELFEDAGRRPSSQRQSRTGVWIGACNFDYRELLDGEMDLALGHRATGGLGALLANRISYFYDLRGPSETVDTACSSSLVALHTAIQSLRAGDCDQAIVGGVNLICGAATTLSFAAAGMLSPTGRCRPFGADADGYARGEGAGLVLLKPLAQAIADGDHVYGVVEGSAVGHGGQAASLTAPNPAAQAEVLLRAFKAARIAPWDLDYIEAHGTGTALGDPIEVAGIVEAFERRAAECGRTAPADWACGLGSVKSNIGHLESAAGAAGLIKLLLCLRQGALPATLSCLPGNPELDLAGGHLTVLDAPRTWRRRPDARRRAGVSSFGFGGVSAHVVIGDYQQEPGDETSEDLQILPLSAQSEDQLRRVHEDLVAWIADQQTITPGPPSVREIAWTLQDGREAFRVRDVIVARSMSQLHATLIRRIEAGGAWDQRKAAEEAAAALGGVAAPVLEDVVHDWMSGNPVDWGRLHPDGAPRRTSLPTYPFARQSYWASSPKTHDRAVTLSAPPIEMVIERGDRRLQDHRVDGQPTAPAALQLGLVLQAAGSLDGIGQAKGATFKGVHWLRRLAPRGDSLKYRVDLVPEGQGVQFALRDADADTGACAGIVQGGIGELPRLNSPPEAFPRPGESAADPQTVYERFAAAHLDYGPTYRTLRGLRLVTAESGELQALAALATAGESADQSAWLHPGLLDGALQACLALRSTARGTDDQVLPFYMDTLWLRRGSPLTLRAVANFSPGRGAPHCDTFDIDLIDAADVVWAQVRGLRVRSSEAGGLRGPKPDPDALAELELLAPSWRVVDGKAPPTHDGFQSILVVGADRNATPRLQTDLPYAYLRHAPTVTAAASVLTGDPVDQVIWFVTAEPEWAVHTSVADQQEPLCQAFSLARALLDAGYGARRLALTIMTRRARAVRLSERPDPAVAAALGFAEGLAVENPTWQVRLIDADTFDDLAATAPPFLIGSGEAQAWAVRDKQWFCRRLSRAQLDLGPPLYRHGGVYLVVGGAGGLGSVWSEHLIRRYDARIAWVGRRPLDPTIAERLDRLAALGHRPLYVQADASDPEQFRHAVEVVRQALGPIDGVVSSTLVLRDVPVAAMDRSDLLEPIAAKLGASLSMAQALAGQPLDFVLFFSSMRSFFPEAGQANYAAGCAYMDALAERLALDWDLPVKVINWGYWGDVGAVAGRHYRARMAAKGIGSLTAEEGMAALDALMQSSTPQVVCMKVQDGVGRGVPFAGGAKKPAIQLTGDPDMELDALIRRVLPGLLRTIEAQGRRTGSPKHREAWIARSWSLLGDRQEDVGMGLPLAAASPGLAGERGADPASHAKAELVAASLRHLEAILAGDLRATDALFPGGSTALVQAAYADAATEHANRTLAGVVAKVAERRIGAQAPGVRILEVGAGTGATTRNVLRELAAAGLVIAEYRFTDVTPVFLDAARAGFDGVEAMTYGLANIEEPLAPQGTPDNAYDVVIAANVVHATSDVARTLRHLGAALRPGGVLAMCEITHADLFTHLTFGLLDGWWRAQDPSIRLPDCPGLSSEGWTSVLKDCGYGPVVIEPTEAAGRHRVIWAAHAGPSAGPGVLPQQATGEPAAKGVDGTGALKTLVRSKIAEALKCDPNEVLDAVAFAEFGVDSIMAIRIAKELGRALDIQLPTIVLFDENTVERLATFLQTEHGARPVAPSAAPRAAAPVLEGPVAGPAATVSCPARSAAAAPPPSAAAEAADRIAVIGMSGRFASVKDVDEFWAALAAGQDLTGKRPRWRPSPGAAAPALGGYLDDVAAFDPLFFNISGTEAAAMDPQQRIFLEEAWKALEDAGYAGQTPRGCGIFAGCTAGDYQDLLGETAPPQAFWSNAASVIPARVAYHLDLDGPALAIDTACSSALVAVHLAYEALVQKRCHLALAGGVFVQSTGRFHLLSAKADMLSASGKCRAFDARADGLVLGEGAGVIVLKRLGDALRDRDQIHGVIRASALNQDGATNGITAPSARAQEHLVRRVLDLCDTKPEEVGMVEAHGTGTPLGDPIEFRALSRAYASGGKEFCALGSVKTNLGHTAWAAGVASVIKVLLAFKHEAIPATLNCEDVNPAVPLEGSPFFLNRGLRPWPRAVSARLAAVSSFGFSGTNAHLLLQDAPEVPRAPETVSPRLYVLSARTHEQLRQQAANLAGHLRRGEVRSGDVAFTLMVGRRALPHRLACVADSAGTLLAALGAWLEDEPADNLVSGRIDPDATGDADLLGYGEACIAQCAAEPFAADTVDRLAVLAQLFVSGCRLDYGRLFLGDERRTSLPAYPFAREPYWCGGEPQVERAAEASSVPDAEKDVTPPAQNLSSAASHQEPPSSLRSRLLGFITDIVAVPKDEIDGAVELSEYGFDSLTLTELALRINRTFGLELTPATFYQYPSLDAIVGHLTETAAAPIAAAMAEVRPEVDPLGSTLEMGALSDERAEAVRQAPTSAPEACRDVAVIGMSCVFPGSRDLEGFWKTLAAGGEAIAETPPTRWDWRRARELYQADVDEAWLRWGGFIEGVDEFDPLFFGISPREAELMEPHQRLLMMQVWKALEDAGHAPSSLKGRRVGLFFGMGGLGEYGGSTGRRLAALEGLTATAHAGSLGPGRISYLLDLHGPSEVVETACSSSLLAVHRAAEAVRRGECDMAIAGGVNLLLGPDGHVGGGRAGIVSPSGHCRPFSRDADGFVRGEGVGVVVLTSLERAREEGDRICGVILSSAVNHGGRAQSLTAPNVAAQAQLVQDVQQRAGIGAAAISYVEAHGTGTALGDPAEVDALKLAFGSPHGEIGQAWCGLGSVKGNIGHLEAAAGVASLIKVLLQFERNMLAPSLHCEALNPYLKLGGSPFFVVDRPRPWLPGQDKRRAGVSAFGVGGVNVHLIVEEPPVQAHRPSVEAHPSLIILSARDEQRLADKVADLRQALEASVVKMPLADIAFTLQVGRDAMEHRVAFMVTSHAELLDRLAAFLAGERSGAGVHIGRARIAKPADPSLKTWLQEGRLEALADAWVQGMGIDWEGLVRPVEPRRVRLPTYPFARERYWVGDVAEPAPRAVSDHDAGDADLRRLLTQLGAGEIGYDDAVRRAEQIIAA